MMMNPLNDLHASQIVGLTETDQMRWTEVDASAMMERGFKAVRAFEGRYQGYTVLVTQANVCDPEVDGIDRPHIEHLAFGSAVAHTVENVVVMPIRFTPDQAEQLYRKITAQRN